MLHKIIDPSKMTKTLKSLVIVRRLLQSLKKGRSSRNFIRFSGFLMLRSKQSRFNRKSLKSKSKILHSSTRLFTTVSTRRTKTQRTYKSLLFKTGSKTRTMRMPSMRSFSRMRETITLRLMRRRSLLQLLSQLQGDSPCRRPCGIKKSKRRFSS